VHKKDHQLKAPKKRRYITGGVTLPILPYYYLWYGGTNFMAPYGGPGGANETAQNDFGKDSTSGTGTDSGSGTAGGDGGGSGSV
jgi:hypothetical protein